MKILLLSAYHAASHKQWCDGLMDNFPEHQWCLLSLPPRYFNWHMRGNAYVWAKNQQKRLIQSYDLVIATSMTDLHGLRGFMPNLADIPCLLYFHENQFEYPGNESQQNPVELQLVSFFSAVCADKIAFNSQYNYQTFILGLQSLLQKLPDFIPKSQIDDIKQKTIVLPVPIADQCYGTALRKGKNLRIVWNHRWEYDKWPENFFLALLKLVQSGVDFDLYVLGQQFRQQPPIFAEMQQKLSKNIKYWGYVENVEEYRQILRSADVVVSTALHDFQGLAVLEAVASGCLPVVPNRLVYSEFFQPSFRYHSIVENNEQQADLLATQLNELINEKNHQTLSEAPDISALSWAKMKKKYALTLNQVKNGKNCS